MSAEDSTGPAPAPAAVRAVFSILKPHMQLLVVSMLAGIASGFALTVLLATVSEGLAPDAGTLASIVLAYCGAAALTVATAIISDRGTNVVGQRLVADLRIDLSARILRAPIDELERYRLHRLLTVLNGDIDAISLFAFNVAPLTAALAVVTGCMAYLAWLSPPAFLVAVICLAAGALIQYRVKAKGVAGFEKARTAEDELQKSFNAIALGAKELRLDRPRRMAVFEGDIGRTAALIRETQIGAVRHYITGRVAGSVLFFGLIAILLAWRDAGFYSAATLGGFVLVLLYVRGPIEQLIGILPMVNRAQIAFGRIDDLSRCFDTAEPYLLAGEGPARVSLHSTIELAGAAYRFVGPDGPGFCLGPIDLVVRRGEITFIVGDNGSGKTTLIKLLLGLYEPAEGNLLLDGKPVTAWNRDSYRQLFATVLSDFHLFEEVGVDSGEIGGEIAASYLHRLALTGKAAIHEGRFSTTDLSTGQRKRLAFIQACASNRPVLVFDEWAADQDPTFRHLFYTELLPELREAGRTLVVISHDDRYFGIANRIVHLEGGRIVNLSDSEGRSVPQPPDCPHPTERTGALP